MSASSSLEVRTAAGVICVELHLDVAPKTINYVLDLVNQGAYDGSTFYRSATLGHDREPLIQGGPFCSVITGATKVEPDLPMLEDFETTQASGLRHVAGTVSLARDLSRTNHGISEWFICLDDYPDLDFGGRTDPDDRGFPAFGTVVEGLDVARSIAVRQADGATRNRRLAGQILNQPVEIHSIALAG